MHKPSHAQYCSEHMDTLKRICMYETFCPKCTQPPPPKWGRSKCLSPTKPHVNIQGMLTSVMDIGMQLYYISQHHIQVMK